ncbi:MAG: GHKL domain-containing protein [Lachnospiraceae bacterium]|nr:GHKL domain-containing protein [Lachnospiraceae bacterium]
MQPGLAAFLTAFLYEIISTLPYRVIAYYPFRKQLRFSVGIIAFVIGFTQLLESAVYAWLAPNNAFWGRIAEYVFAVICFLIFMNTIKISRWKLLFIYIFLFDYIILVRGTAFFIEARLFYSEALTFDTPRSVLFNLIVLAVTMPFMIRYLQHTKDLAFQTEAPSLWRVIWILPGFTTLIVMMYTSGISPETVWQLRFFFSRVLLIVCMLGIFNVLLEALSVIRHEAVIEEERVQQESLLALQRTQYSQLSRHMQETRQARHDLIQHLRIINSFISTGSQDALRDYVENYELSLPPNTNRSFSKNYAVNTMVSYYAEEAEHSSVDFTAKLNLPEPLPLNEAEFCSMLGNLLENALLACREVTDVAPYIRVLAKENNQKILITVDNTSSKEPVIKDGQFLSSRHEGYGLGTASVRTIAQRHHGSATFRYERGVFYASVILDLSL